MEWQLPQSLDWYSTHFTLPSVYSCRTQPVAHGTHTVLQRPFFWLLLRNHFQQNSFLFHWSTSILHPHLSTAWKTLAWFTMIVLGETNTRKTRARKTNLDTGKAFTVAKTAEVDKTHKYDKKYQAYRARVSSSVEKCNIFQFIMSNLKHFYKA